MIARFILPWYGGSSAVWSTCLLFFQAGLLIGYGYSHLLAKRLSIKNQVIVHLSLLIISLISLPIIPKEWMRPDAFGNPVFGILSLLTLTVGFPYIMVSTTGPLMQHWFSLSNPKQSPYRLYALSNLGSLIGLLAYPALVEPNLDLKTQAWSWTVGYMLFIVLCGLIGKQIWKTNTVQKLNSKKQDSIVTINSISLWLLFSFLGTLTLLSFTNKLTQDTVVIPFLWILPLSLYLITFIIAFEKPGLYNRKLFIPVMLILIGVIINNQIQSDVFNKPFSVTAMVVQYCLGVFAICMVVHGELSRLKPVQNNLTLFYFIISLGGVLGGIFVNMIVPFIFKNYWEIYLSFAGSILLVGYILIKHDKVVARYRVISSVSVLVIVTMVLFAFRTEHKNFTKNVLVSSRNFYGVLKVTEEFNINHMTQRSLIHGGILHGVEIMDSAYSNIPFTYYTAESGIGLVLSKFPGRYDANFQGMKVGIIGLGTGSISCYGISKDLYKYYEINPEVEIVARKYFKFISNFKGITEIKIGDGRTVLENELKESSNQFDVLAIDAFSGDNIPAHLLTMEAGDLYFKHIKKDGILAFHITNSYVDLIPVLCGMAEKFKKSLYYVIKQADDNNPIGSLWALFTENKKFVNDPEMANFIQVYDVAANEKVYWTDNHTSILPLIKKDE